MIRTKIVATLGPATNRAEMIVKLLGEGADVFRLNFSHGELADHAKMLSIVRQAEERFGEPAAVLGDLCGPKIRLGQIADEGGTGGMPINVGDTLHILRRPIGGEPGRVSTNYPGFVDDVRVGDRVLIEDGLLRFLAIDKTKDEVVCSCTEGGVLKTGKGVNLPNTPVNLPSITEKDWRCVDWAIDNQLDYLALSFVRKAAELIELRQHLEKRGSGIALIAKIEKPEALRHIDAIIEASDGLMVARGDLGVEMDMAQVPIIQKDLIRRCGTAGKPVIVATQMLQSMIESSSPTRAEVSDVANAIFDGTDAVMLSGETSVGKWPAAAVYEMNHIAEVTEAYLDSIDGTVGPAVRDSERMCATALARGVWQIVHDLKAKLVVIWSQTGSTARVFSKTRFPVPIVAFSDKMDTLRRMTLNYGVAPWRLPSFGTVRELIAQVDRMVREKLLAAVGERIVIVTGPDIGLPGTMNGIVVHTVGEG